MKAIVAMVVLAGCGDVAIQMTLLLPTERANFDPACVSAVDVLPLAAGDKMPGDLSERAGDIPCITIKNPASTFGKLATEMANQIDVPLPSGGLSAVAVRGRVGSCEETPAKHEAIFFGGGAYSPGSDQLAIKLQRGLNCNPTRSVTVKAVDLPALFLDVTHTCVEYTDPSATLVAGEIRPTLVPSHPAVVELGGSTAPLNSGATVSAFVVSWKDTCPAIGLTGGAKTALTCLTSPSPPSACAGSSTELAVLPASYAADSADPALVKKFAGTIIVGVWSASGTIGPVANATLAVEAGEDAQIVYGAIGATKLTTSGASSTDETGGAIVYANGVVHLTATALGRSTAVYVGAAPDQPSAVIIALP